MLTIKQRASNGEHPSSPRGTHGQEGPAGTAMPALCPLTVTAHFSEKAGAEIILALSSIKRSNLRKKQSFSKPSPTFTDFTAHRNHEPKS